MITTHFNNVKIQSAEYSNYFWNILHFCSEGQAKNMGKCKNAIICLVRFLFWKMFQNRRNSEFAKKNHLLSTLKYLLTSKRTKCSIPKMGFQLHNTSLWFLTLFLQFMKVHFILLLNTWITLYNVSNFISRRDCISKILTFFFEIWSCQKVQLFLRWKIDFLRKSNLICNLCSWTLLSSTVVQDFIDF